MADFGQAIKDMCRAIERRHDLRKGFFAGLIKQPDWSFIIQCHALIEAAVADALTCRTRNKDLRQLFDRLDLSNFRTGKVAFARSYGLITGEQVKFIQAFSELGNELVHRIGNVNFDLSEHIAMLGVNDAKLKSWCLKVCAAHPVMASANGSQAIYPDRSIAGHDRRYAETSFPPPSAEGISDNSGIS